MQTRASAFTSRGQPLTLFELRYKNRIAIIIVIIFYQGKTPGGGSKITKVNYEICLVVNRTLAGRHQ